MTTWILFLQITIYNGFMVPDYPTEQACQVAAKAFLAGAGSWSNKTAFCIPGAK